MFKQHIIKLVLSLVVTLTLLSGVALGINTLTAQKAPAHHLMACGGDAFPPCDAPVY